MKPQSFLIVWLFCFAQTLFAQQTSPVLVYSDSTKYIETSPYAAVLEDAKAEWTIEQVKAMPDSVFHRPTKAGRLNLSSSDSRFWVRFYVDNKTNEDSYFLNNIAIIQFMDLYTVSKDGTLKTYPPNGILRPVANRSLPIHKINFNLGKDATTLYLAIKTNRILYFSNFIGSKEAIYGFAQRDERVFFFGFGLYFILILYSLSIYFNSRDKPFLWYAVFQFGCVLYFLYYSGIGYTYIWQHYPILNKDSNIHVGICIISACIFSMYFLNTLNLIPRFHLFLQILIGGYCIGIVMQLLSFNAISNAISLFFNLAIYTSLWIAAWLVYFKKNRTVRFYLIGWTIYLFSTIKTALIALNLTEQPPDWIVDNYPNNIATAIESICMAFALADRIREMRQQARDTQLLLLKQTEKYEQLVQKQTLLLEEKLQLEQQNKPENKAELTELLRKMRTEQSLNRRLSVPTTEGVLWIPTQDIIRLEAMRSYCSIHLTNGKRLVASHPLSDFEKQLDTVEFMRVHKSHLVNMSQIQEYIRGEGGSLVLKDGSSVSVSRTTKQAVLERLGI